jgi:hypothetical protein
MIQSVVILIYISILLGIIWGPALQARNISIIPTIYYDKDRLPSFEIPFLIISSACNAGPMVNGRSG